MQVESLQRKFALIHSTLSQQAGSGGKASVERLDDPSGNCNYLYHRRGWGPVGVSHRTVCAG